MKRADSKRLGGGNKNNNSSKNGAGGGAAGLSNGTRHSRHSSARLKHTRGAGTSWDVRRIVFGSLGLAVVFIVYNVIHLKAKRDNDVGFSYNEASLRGDRDQWQQVQKPLPRPLPAAPATPLPTVPPRPPPSSGGDAVSREDGGGGREEPSTNADGGEDRTMRPKKKFSRRAADNFSLRPSPKKQASKTRRERPTLVVGGPNQQGGRSEKYDEVTSGDGINRAAIRGAWEGGVGWGIDADVDAIAAAAAAAAAGAAAVVAATLNDFDKRAVIINADELSSGSGGRGGGGGGGRGESGGAVRWKPGQLTRIAELQQQQRVEEDQEEWGGVSRTPMLGEDAALLVICANRPEYLERTLQAVAEYHPGSSRGAAFAIPVVVSQDGTSKQVADVISRFKTSMAGRAHVIHIQHTPPPRETRAYFKLSAHYKWALGQAFDELERTGYNWASKDKVIILEEDLEIAPDFFEYFSATAPLLDADETLMAVSAWNDNGQARHVKDNEALFRSDFFPGLGWMLPRRVWEELADEWPEAYWDDWLRAPPRRRERQFIRPEVCRTYHFGQRAGASKNQFGNLLQDIKLNTEAVPFREMDLSYLEPGPFREWLGGILWEAPSETIATIRAGRASSSAVKVEYDSERDFVALAGRLGIMSDTKASIPRTAYMGVVPLWVGDTQVYLAPREVSHQMLS
ncbi:unnamed protein product [Scytosiphon promiscuus]